MKLIINTQKFTQAIKAVERIVGKNVSLPILGTILLDANKGHLILSTTNLEMGVRYSIGAKIEKEGKISIPAKLLSDFIVNVKDEKITLSVSKEVMTITSKSYKTNILGMKPDEFPIIPTFKNREGINVNSKNLRNGIVSVVDSVSTSETRPELTGVYVNIEKNNIDFAATDSYRLAEIKIDIQKGEKNTCIIPQNTALEMVRLLDEEDDITMVLADNQIALQGVNFELVSRLIDGHYPDYKKVLPDSYVGAVSVDKSELERTIRMAGVFSSSISDLLIKAEGSEMKILAKNSEKGEASASIVCELEKDPFEISVNYQYLLDGLKIVSEDVVTLRFTGEGGPLLLKNKSSENLSYAIMPLRS